MAKSKEEEAQAPEAVAIEPSEFDSLLKKEFKPKSDRARDAISSAVRTLAEQAMADTAVISDDAVQTIEGIIAEIDRKLSEQIHASRGLSIT
jgi:type VI secretion system protein ImpC